MADDRAYSYDVFERFTERWPEIGDRLLSPGRDTFLAEDAFERRFRLLRGYKRVTFWSRLHWRSAMTGTTWFSRLSLTIATILNWRLKQLWMNTVGLLA